LRIAERKNLLSCCEKILAMTPPGRNDLCHCGSGRKYKLCCLRSAELIDLRAVRLRRDEGTVVPTLLEFAASFYGAFLLKEAWGRFLVNSTPPETELTDELYDQLFIPWFLFDFVADPDARRKRGVRIPPSTVAAIYLELFPQKVSESERAFIETALGTTVSYHLVTDVSPGRGIDLENLLTGDKRRVYEQSASKTVKPGVVLFARVVAIGESAIMSGCAPLVLPPLWRIEIMDLRDRLAAASGRSLGLTDVRRAGDRLLELFHRAFAQILNPRPPTLVNTDGERIEPSTLRFAIRCSVRDAFDRLRTLSLWKGDEAMEDPKYGRRGELLAVSLDWSKRGNRMHTEWDNTTLGHLRIERSVLTASVNSRRRAARIRRQIERRLGPDVSFTAQVHETLPRTMRTSQTNRFENRSREAGPMAEDLGPELRAQLADMLARRWEQWVDDRIPALGHLTPREAARTTAGRARLEALLADYEWHNESQVPHLRMDVNHLRRKVGLLPR
jgi:SEC-C motif